MRAWMVSIVCLGLLAACGGGGSTGTDAGGGGGTDTGMASSVQGSCDHRPTTGNTDCLDFEGYPASEITRLMTECIGRGETWSGSACPRTGIMGGCRYSVAGMTNTYWYYSGDIPSLMTACTGGGATWVTP